MEPLDRQPDLMQAPFKGSHVVLFFGGRDCTYESHGDLIRADVGSLGVGSLVLHGGAPGADMIADNYARLLAWSRELHVARVDALWSAYGKRAGPLRNNVMARMLRPVYAFGYPTGGPGSAGMIEVLERESIPYSLREVAHVA